MILTFYSYKGGVGRSMALVNIASLLCKAGLRVIVVDWDLEAPGLERFFLFGEEAEKLREKEGILDLLIAYKQKATTFNQASGEILSTDELERYLFTLRDASSSEVPSGSLRILPSGRRPKDDWKSYSNRVKSFDWKEFYEVWHGEFYFELLRKKLLELADVVLIDSRTGLSEMGGVCTYQLADLIVVLCAPNIQNLEGTEQMVKSFLDPKLKPLRYDRDLKVLVVPARVERSAELGILNQFRKEFWQTFKDYLPKKLSMRSYFEHLLIKLEIPYMPRYAFKEIIAVDQPRSGPNRSIELEEAYNFLLRQIHQLADPKSRFSKQLLKFSKRQLEQVQPIPSALWEFSHTLGFDWQNLADFFGVSPLTRHSFERGRESQELLSWLEARSRLHELPSALAAIDREDLKELAYKVLEFFEPESPDGPGPRYAF